MVKDITVFTRTTCAPCRMLKSWLKYKNLGFSEIDVDANPDAMNDVVELSNFAMVPCTVVTKVDGSKQVISGYNLSALAALV